MSALGQKLTLSTSDCRIDRGHSYLKGVVFHQLVGCGQAEQNGNEISDNVLKSGAVESCATPARDQ
jgi:hypothetical protein